MPQSVTYVSEMPRPISPKHHSHGYRLGGEQGQPQRRFGYGILHRWSFLEPADAGGSE